MALSAEQSLHEGDLDTAFSQLLREVRREPANAKHRVFLFQLCAILGQWERALNQLNIAGDLDASNLAMVQTYRPALQCEALRCEVFAGKRTPHFMGEPEPWLALLVEALSRAAQGEYEVSQSIREEAFEAAPVTAGCIGDQSFDWIADADPRLGPIVEAIVNGRYYWVPFQQIQAIELERPSDLRDLVWLPAQFTWVNGGQMVGLIPVRYSGSQASPDPLIRLARKTAWLEQEAGLYFGLGQRMWVTDVHEYALLDVRQLQLAPEEADGG